jgi:hypothetical protein
MRRSAVALGFVLTCARAFAGPALDRVVVMVEAPELGGNAHPFFVLEREWAVALEVLRGKRSATSPRRMLDGELGLRLLEARADRIEEDAAGNDPPFAARLRARRAELETRIRSGLLARVGAASAVDRMRAIHPSFDRAIESLVRRRAGAAIGAEALDLFAGSVDEGEARELFRQGGHPFEAARFEDAREAFADWLLVDRLGRAGQRHFDQVRRLVRVSFGGIDRKAAGTP